MTIPRAPVHGSTKAAAQAAVPPRTRRVAGFSLIELMVALLIVGILTAIAYPAYSAYTRRGHRADAQAYLMHLAQLEQQYFTDNRSYAADPTVLAAVPSTVAPYYTVTIAAPAGAVPPTFTITATAIGSQLQDGNLTLNNAGATTPAGVW